MVYFYCLKINFEIPCRIFFKCFFNMIKHLSTKAFSIFAFIFIIFDSSISFFQFYGTQLEGDVALTVAPTPAYQKVLTDPLGISASIYHQNYAAPNRFFAHSTVYHYFRTVPLWLQKLGVQPINSIYLSCALIKLLTQLLMVSVLSIFVRYFSSSEKWILAWSAVIFVSLFQTRGFDGQMGIINDSISYFFCYAFPLFVFLCFLLPFGQFYGNENRSRHPFITGTLLTTLCFIIPFDGSTICGISLIFVFTISLLLFIKIIKNSESKRAIDILKTIPLELLIPLFLLGIMSIYSLYVGTFNQENNWETISMTERYARLPIGLFKILTKRIGLPILLILTTINIVFIKKQAPKGAHKIVSLITYLALFSILYLLLLPLGGYRSYREYIIRFDTFLPVTICIIFSYVLTTVSVLQIAQNKTRVIFLTTFILVIFIFTAVDLKTKSNNDCERRALQTLSETKQKTIELNCDCTVLSWIKINRFEDSQSNAIMLKYWNITQDTVLYKHQ